MSKNLAKVCEGTLQLSRFVFFAMQYKNWYFYNTVMTFQERESFFLVGTMMDGLTFKTPAVPKRLSRSFML